MRTVRVCVLNDIHYPANEQTIATSLRVVFQEYRTYTGIQFSYDRIFPYEYNLTAWSIDQGMYLRQTCNRDAEIKLVFSSKIVQEQDAAFFSPTEKNRELGESANAVWGYVLIYNTDFHYNLISSVGEPALFTVLRHGIAHLFHVEHSNNTDSFMYPILSETKGLWDRDTLTQILKNRNTRWFP